VALKENYMINKYLYVLLAISLVQSLLVVRQAAWINWVAIPYMVGNQKEINCAKDVIFENRLPIIERKIGIRSFVPKFSTESCDDMEKHWDKYEETRDTYRKWFKPFSGDKK